MGHLNMKRKIYKWLITISFNTVAAGLTALIIFFCMGLLFPRSAKSPEPAAAVPDVAASADTAAVSAFLDMDKIISARALNETPGASASAPGPSVSAAQTVNPAAAGSPAPSASRPPMLALTAGDDNKTGEDNQAGEGNKAPEEEIEQPPSILEILSRSIFSYKTLLSREMPFIYGTEDISQNIEKMMEDETAPEEMSEEIKLEITKIEQEAKKETMLEKTASPQILIYHTHTLEAYRQTKDSQYVAVGNCRTKDQGKSVVAVGDVLQKELQKYGYKVLHSKVNHEPPELNSAYSRSLKTMKAYKEKYKSIRVFIDLHRDASSDTDDVVMIDGKRCAKVMFVVGLGKSSSIKPDWKQSYKIANAISSKLEDIKKGFTRKVRIKEIRSYNQYMSDMCMLVEVGHNGNTLQEAKNTMPYLAKALSEVIKLQQ